MRKRANEYIADLRRKAPQVSSKDMRLIAEPNKDLVEHLLYIEHDNQGAFENRLASLKPISCLGAWVLKTFKGYEDRRRQAA